MQRPDNSVVQAVLDFFRWLAERIGVDRAIGVTFALLVMAIGWRIYNDRRKDQARIEELTEHNRTVAILERELEYYKTRELAHTALMSFEEARKLVSRGPP